METERFAVGMGGNEQKRKKMTYPSFVRQNLGQGFGVVRSRSGKGGGVKAHAHTALLASLQPRV